MATLQQALTRIDAICPNAWDETAKLLWINECESMIQTRILGAAPEACITYDADTDRSTTLLVPAPFDRLYVYYVIAMCDYAAHETAHYADSMMLFNAALDEYAKWYQRTNGSVTSTPGLANEIAANSKARHTHENLAVLNAITAGTTAAWNAKADRTAATATAPGLMSAADKAKLDTIEAHAKDVDVDDTLSLTSQAAIMNKTVTAALGDKADKTVASQAYDGLMSAADKRKLDGLGSLGDLSYYDIEARVNTADYRGIDSVCKHVFGCTVSHTFAEISAAVKNGQTPRVLLSDSQIPSIKYICPMSNFDSDSESEECSFAVNGSVYAGGILSDGQITIDNTGATYTCGAGDLPAVDSGDDGKYLFVQDGRWHCTMPNAATTTAPGMMSAADKAKLDGIAADANKTVVDAALDDTSENPVQNKAIKAALDGKAGTATATATANGLMSAADKVKLDGVETGANKTVVDAALDGTSENPVQNKAVKTELDKKLNQSGGTVTGSLTLKGAVFSDSGLSFGTGENIHFTKAADDAAKLAHGAADVDDNVPLARLKVAAPTEGDDAATKQYVDALAAENVQDFLNAPVLTSPVMIRKAGATTSSGVYLSTVDTGEKQAEIKLEDVNENSPVAIANLRTPTGDGSDSYAATKGYVDSKVAEGGVTVDGAMSATSTNPVQNKAVHAELSKKANSTDPLLRGTVTVADASSGANVGLGVGPFDGDESYAALELSSASSDGVVIGGLADIGDAEALGRGDTAVCYTQMKNYVDGKVAEAAASGGSTTPITITLGTGGKATSSAGYADICQALTSGRSVMLVGATGKAFWHLLSHTVGNNNNVVLNYADVSVSGGAIEVTRYTVTVTASGITYSSGSWTNE